MPALDYTALFGDLGSLISRINSYQALGESTLPQDGLTLRTQFGTRWLPEEGIAAYYEGLRDLVGGWRRDLSGWADRRLSDRDLVTLPLGLTSPALLDVLAALYKDMLAQGKTVEACVCGAGPVTAKTAPANAGSGAVFLTTTLDGSSSPGRGSGGIYMPANPYYDSSPSQLLCNETMTLECVADGGASGGSPPDGRETWQVAGATRLPEYDTMAEGSGPGPTFQTANAAGFLAGVDFEGSAGGPPPGWTVESGTAVLDDSQYFRGSMSLKVTGGAVLSQRVGSSTLDPRRRYLLALAVKAAGAVAGGRVRAYFRGTGYNPGLNLLEVPGSSLSSSWQIKGAGLTAPPWFPDDWAFVLEVAGLGAGSLWLDSLAFAPYVWHGGVGVAVCAGATPFLLLDRFSWPCTNDRAGLFQDWFRRHYGVQLPSIRPTTVAPFGMALGMDYLLMTGSSTPSIPDSWAA